MILGRDSERARLVELFQLHQPVLVSGPKGAGKWSLLTEAMVDEESYKVEPKGESLRVQDVRDAIAWGNTSPLTSFFKVVLIRDLHKATPASSFALLKWTEEPPKWVHIAATSCYSRWPVLESRFQRLFCPLFSKSQLRDFLYRAGYGSSAVESVLPLAGGSFSSASAHIKSQLPGKFSELESLLKTGADAVSQIMDNESLLEALPLYVKARVTKGMAVRLCPLSDSDWKRKPVQIAAILTLLAGFK